MKLNLKIALYGETTGPIINLLSHYGEIDIIESGEPPKDIQIIVIDCAHQKHALDEKFLYRNMKRGRKICLLYMNDLDRKLIFRLTKNSFSTTGENIVIYMDSIMPGGFKHYVLPEYEKIGKQEIKDVLRFLNNRIFSADCGGGSPPIYGIPPETVHTLWPETELAYLNGSSKQLFDTGLLKYKYPAFDPGIEQTCRVRSTAYFYLSNGVDGDNNYHIIIHTHFSNMYPFSHYQGTNGKFGSQYDLSIQFVRDQKIITGPELTAYRSTPAPQNPRTYKDLGAILMTSFGAPPFGFPVPPPGSGVFDVNLSVLGARCESPSDKTTIVFHPTFYQVLGQYKYPSIGAIKVTSKDTPDQTSVSFKTEPSDGSFDTNPGELSIINYFIMQGGLDVNKYLFNINLDVGIGMLNMPDSGLINHRTHSAAINLIESTKHLKTNTCPEIIKTKKI